MKRKSDKGVERKGRESRRERGRERKKGRGESEEAKSNNCLIKLDRQQKKVS